jgi:hypothetical protein
LIFKSSRVNDVHLLRSWSSILVRPSRRGGVGLVPNTYPLPVSDPFSSVPAPSASTMSTYCSTTLNPGIYSSILISGNSTVTMNPGTYVVTGSISCWATGA